MTLFIAALAMVISLGATAGVWMLWNRLESSNRRIDQVFEENRNLALKLKKLGEQRLQPSPKQDTEVYTRPRRRLEQPAEPPQAKQPKQPENVDNEASTIWQDVIFLAQQGVSVDKISRDLNITRGEVDLILSLQNFKPGEDEQA